ncbi:MAG: hypothetical protein ACOVQG_08805 [Crocinitomicaceae bacterium]|jgi:hypothetical protein
MGLKYIHPDQFISGLSESRYSNYETNDCVVKAFSILFGISYDEAHGFTRGFFDRTERNGTGNFSNSMKKLIRNSNFSFNGNVNRVKLNKAFNIKQIQNEFQLGVYLVVTFDHVTVLCDGVFVDYQNISKPRDLVYEVFEFSDFAHHDEIRSKIHKKEDSKVGWFFIVVVILFIGLFDQRDKVERDLIKLKIWIKKEIFKN